MHNLYFFSKQSRNFCFLFFLFSFFNFILILNQEFFFQNKKKIYYFIGGTASIGAFLLYYNLPRYKQFKIEREKISDLFLRDALEDREHKIDISNLATIVIPSNFIKSINETSYVKKTVPLEKPLEITVDNPTELDKYLQNPQFENNSFVQKIKPLIKKNNKKIASTLTLKELKDMRTFLMGSSIGYFHGNVLYCSAVEKQVIGQSSVSIKYNKSSLCFLGRDNNNNEISFERLIVPTKLLYDNGEVIFAYRNKVSFTLQKNLNADSYSINSFLDQDNKNTTTNYVVDMIKDNQEASKEFTDYDPENLYYVSTTGYLEKSKSESKSKFFCPKHIYHYDKNREKIIDININMKFPISTIESEIKSDGDELL